MSSIDILSIIKQLHEQKIRNKIVPNHVTEIELISEICKDMRMELSRLIKDGAISEIRTLNDKAYLIKK